jgi:hypothetical protein
VVIYALAAAALVVAAVIGRAAAIAGRDPMALCKSHEIRRVVRTTQCRSNCLRPSVVKMGIIE